MAYKTIIEMVFQSAIIAFFLSNIICLVYCLYLCICNKKLTHVKSIYIQIYYFIMLFFITVFRGDFTQNTVHSINMLPFLELQNVFNLQYQILGLASALTNLIYNIVGNIVWFIPLGWIVTKYYRLSFFKTVMIGFLVSFSIESLQYILYTGISDIDDIIFNVIGTTLGYILYKIFGRK